MQLSSWKLSYSRSWQIFFADTVTPPEKLATKGLQGLQLPASVFSNSRLALAQPGIDGVSRVAALANRPHNQRRSPVRIAGGKNSRHAGAMRSIGRDVSPTVQLYGEIH